eukprot:1161587-Pelagomonas_calceolata.AAC.15
MMHTTGLCCMGCVMAAKHRAAKSTSRFLAHLMLASTWKGRLPHPSNHSCSSARSSTDHGQPLYQHSGDYDHAAFNDTSMLPGLPEQVRMRRDE